MTRPPTKILAVAVAGIATCVGFAADASELTWAAFQDAALQAAKHKEYPKAKRLFFEAAKEAARDRPGGNPGLFIQSILGLAKVLIHEADYADAERVLKEVLRFSEALGSQHPDLAHAHSELALIYFRTGKFDASEAEARAALDATAPQSPPADVAVLLNNLANVECARKNCEAAEALANRAISLARTSTDGDAAVIFGLDTLAEIQLQRGDPEDALPLAEKAKALAATALPPDDPFVADIHDTLADIHAALKHRGEAADHSAKAVAINKANYHADHPVLIESLEQLAQHLLAADRKDQADSIQAELTARSARRARSKDVFRSKPAESGNTSGQP